MLIIFDWDGTLADSTAKIVASMKAAAEDLGLPELADGTVRDIIGLGLPEAIAQLYPHAAPGEREALRLGYSEQWIARDHTPSGFYPGALDTLEELKARGYKLAVATGKSRRGLNRVWQSTGTAELFHGSRCADETTSKPDPQMLHELLAEFEVAADKAIMVGDTEFDMEMAARAGVARIGVSYGAHAPERLASYDLLACLDHMPDILKVLPEL